MRQATVQLEGCCREMRRIVHAIQILSVAWVLLSVLILWLAAEAGRRRGDPGQSGRWLTSGRVAVVPCKTGPDFGGTQRV